MHKKHFVREPYKLKTQFLTSNLKKPSIFQLPNRSPEMSNDAFGERTVIGSLVLRFQALSEPAV